MRQFLTLLLVLIVATSGMHSIVLAAPGTGSVRQEPKPGEEQECAKIEGIARNEQGLPMPKQQIILINLKTGLPPVQTVVADETGYFIFNNVQPGHYVVVVTDVIGNLLPVGNAIGTSPEIVITEKCKPVAGLVITPFPAGAAVGLAAGAGFVSLKQLLIAFAAFGYFTAENLLEFSSASR